MNDQLSFYNMSHSQFGKPSLYAIIGGHGILPNFSYWFSGFLQLLGLSMIATDLYTALERSRAFLLLEFSVIATDPTLNIALKRRQSFLLLELFVIALDPAH
jgi:hypothetical protein